MPPQPSPQRQPHRPSSATADAVAAVVQRLAVLLAAGVSPQRAWTYLPATVEIQAVQTALHEGSLVIDALDHVTETDEAASTAWRSLAAAWAVASGAGAPLAPTLRRFARTMRDAAQSEREISVALAGPLATTRLVMWLPAIGLLFGALLGFDTLAVLLGSGAGWTCLISGTGLILIGRRWTRALVRAAQPPSAIAGLAFEVVAISLSGGGAIGPARDRALAAMRERELLIEDAVTPVIPGRQRSPSSAAATAETVARVDAVLELSSRAGVPAAALLRSEAEQERLEAAASARRAAAKLGVRLMLPLAVCTLPAFMLLGVAPLMISVIGTTVAGF